MPPKKPQVTILFVGDMHLGVLPSRIPSHLSEIRQLTTHDLGPAAAWKRIVDKAIELEVHAVALAGDLVDRNNALFEAFGLLEAGFRRLEDANIPVVAVAGNHDTEVLPRLAGMLTNIELLGAGGTWSSHLVHGDDGLAVRLTGWSFPGPHVETSPLGDGAPEPDPKHPTFGLLHADLDQAASRYAPVSTSELLATGYQAWFLGHTHIPGLPNTDGKPFYLGSVTGLNPNETGEHGPVLVNIDPQGKMTMNRLPLAPLRWEKLSISCDDLDDATNDLLPHLLHHLAEKAAKLGESLKDVLALGFRLTLTGAMDNPGDLRLALQGIQGDFATLVSDREGTVLFVEKILNETAQKVDLLDIARAESPEGLLARRILALEDSKEKIPGVNDSRTMKELLVSRGHETLSQVDAQSPYLGIGNPLNADEIAALLAHAGRRSLEEILSRKEAGHAAG